MDMYQKRKMRKEKNSNEQEKSCASMNINCDVGINGNRTISAEISSFL